MSRKKKKPAHAKKINTDKIVKIKENPNEWMDKAPTWKFSGYDREKHDWCVHSSTDFIGDILSKLIDFEGMKWKHIMQQTGGKRRGTNSHFIEASKFIKDAQTRMEQLQYDELFSLRLTGKKRLYGTLKNGVFNILWYDPNHKIVPSQKRNT